MCLGPGTLSPLARIPPKKSICVTVQISFFLRGWKYRSWILVLKHFQRPLCQLDGCLFGQMFSNFFAKARFYWASVSGLSVFGVLDLSRLVSVGGMVCDSGIPRLPLSFAPCADFLGFEPYFWLFRGIWRNGPLY